MQGRPSRASFGADVGPSIKQRLDDGTVASIAGALQRRPSFVALGVDVGAAGKQRFDNGNLAEIGGVFQGRPPPEVRGVDVDAAGKQRFLGGEVAAVAILGGRIFSSDEFKYFFYFISTVLIYFSRTSLRLSSLLNMN